MRATYGIDIESHDDRYVYIAEKGAEGFSASGTGSYLVDYIPIRAYPKGDDFWAILIFVEQFDIFQPGSRVLNLSVKEEFGSVPRMTCVKCHFNSRRIIWYITIIISSFWTSTYTIIL